MPRGHGERQQPPVLSRPWSAPVGQPPLPQQLLRRTCTGACSRPSPVQELLIGQEVNAVRAARGADQACATMPRGRSVPHHWTWTGQLTTGPLAQANAYAMIQRRMAAAGIATKAGNHSFRATGITAYLKNGGSLEWRTTPARARRRRDEITLDEVEKIGIRTRSPPLMHELRREGARHQRPAFVAAASIQSPILLRPSSFTQSYAEYLMIFPFESLKVHLSNGLAPFVSVFVPMSFML